MSLCNHSRNAEHHCLGRDLAQKRKGKYFSLSAMTPALLMAKHSGLLWALFSLGPLGPACSLPAAVFNSLLPKSWPPFRLSPPPSGSGSLSSWQASQHAFLGRSPHGRPGLESPPATRGGFRTAGAPWSWIRKWRARSWEAQGLAGFLWRSPLLAAWCTGGWGEADLSLRPMLVLKRGITAGWG